MSDLDVPAVVFGVLSVSLAATTIWMAWRERRVRLFHQVCCNGMLIAIQARHHHVQAQDARDAEAQLSELYSNGERRGEGVVVTIRYQTM